MATRKPSLKDCHGFCEPAFTGEAGCLEHVDVWFRVHGFGPVVEGRGAKRGLPLPVGKGWAGSKAVRRA